MEMIDRFAHITGDNQPIVRVGRHGGQGLAVFGVGHMEITNGIELHTDSSRLLGGKLL